MFELEKQPIKTNILPPEFGDVITSLIDNSMYTLAEKNKIDKKFIPQIKVSTELSNDTITLKVTDNGKGISPRDLERIFSPFFTTKPTSVGTGLGLFMSKDTIELHNGTNQIQSKENEFTELTIVLPRLSKTPS
jgi:signal transduction histidine kinase